MTTTTEDRERLGRLARIVLGCHRATIYTVERGVTRRAGGQVLDPFVVDGKPARLVNVRPLAIAAGYREHRTQPGVTCYGAEDEDLGRSLMVDVLGMVAICEGAPEGIAELVARYTHKVV